MSTSRRNTPAAISSRYRGRSSRSRRSQPWAVASRAAPQPAAEIRALTSSGAVISSAASTWGFMERSRSIRARALGQPSSTSVRAPTSSWGRPFHRAATSPRSSATPTRWGVMPSPSEAARIRSRSSVVLPAPGAPGSGYCTRFLPAGAACPTRAGPPPPPDGPPGPLPRTGGAGPAAPVPDHRRAAQAHPVSPLYGEVTPAELVGHGVKRSPAGQFQQLLQFLSRHRLPAQGRSPSGSTAAMGRPHRSRSSSTRAL